MDSRKDIENERPYQQDKEQRFNTTIETFKKQLPSNRQHDKSNNNYQRQINGTGYFSQPNVKEYQTRLSTHMFLDPPKIKKGRGTFFATVEDLQQELMAFVQLTNETEVVPTISGLVAWLGCDRQTLYNHAKNPNSPFHDLCNKAIEFCHVALENGASESKINSVAYIFQAKNYFGMKDVQEVQVTPNANDVNSPETLNALKEQLEKENKDQKQIEIRVANYEEVEGKVSNESKL